MARSASVDPEVLGTVKADWARRVAAASPPADVDLEEVIASLEADRQSGALAEFVAKQSPVRYQACAAHPDLLEQVDQTGRVVVGKLVDGKFQPLDPP